MDRQTLTGRILHLNTVLNACSRDDLLQFRQQVRDSLKAQGFDLDTIDPKYRARLHLAECLRQIGEPEAASCYETNNGRMN